MIGAAVAASTQGATINITDGDSPQLLVIDKLARAITYTAKTHAIGYPIAVRDTMWIGERDNAGQAVRYALDSGAAMGNTAALAGPTFGNFVDGAVSGEQRERDAVAVSDDAHAPGQFLGRRDSKRGVTEVP